MNTKPSLKDLYQYFIPQYARYWKDIGRKLGLHPTRLRTIESDHVIGVIQCCKVMLNDWLQIDPTASWSKLFAAIHDIAK